MESSVRRVKSSEASMCSLGPKRAHFKTICETMSCISGQFLSEQIESKTDCRLLTWKHGLDGQRPECRHQQAMCQLPVVLIWVRCEQAVASQLADLFQRPRDRLLELFFVKAVLCKCMARNEDLLVWQVQFDDWTCAEI
jgi:hypothetical protein